MPDTEGTVVETEGAITEGAEAVEAKSGGELSPAEMDAKWQAMKAAKKDEPEEEDADAKSAKAIADKYQEKPKSKVDPKDTVAEAMRKLKIQHEDGTEEEFDEEQAKEIIRLRKQHQKTAARDLTEARALRKQNEQFIAMMKDPEKFYDAAKRLGHDPRALAEKYLAAQLEDELMDPRDKELRDTKRQLEQIKEIEQRQKEAYEAKLLEESKTKYKQEFETQFIEALDKADVPKTKGTVAAMAKYIYQAAQIAKRSGSQFVLTPTEAAQLVRQDILDAHKRLVGDSDGETLIKLLGEDVANKVRKYDTSKLRDPNTYTRTPREQATEHRERGTQTRRLTPREWQLHKRGLK